MLQLHTPRPNSTYLHLFLLCDVLRVLLLHLAQQVDSVAFSLINLGSELLQLQYEIQTTEWSRNQFFRPL